jgi:tetratricopeptide (TPR) repeat protein
MGPSTNATAEGQPTLLFVCPHCQHLLSPADIAQPGPLSCPACRKVMRIEGFATGPTLPPTGSLPQVPGYELLDELGRGGMGVVYRARQLGLNRIVALKMLLTAAAGAAELTRFRREAEALGRLQHPNIVQIHEVGEHEGRPYFALEYVAGGSLDRQLAGSPQPPREAAAFLETVARAVHAAHRCGIVHRDLKPGNILLQTDSPQRHKGHKENTEGEKETSLVPSLCSLCLCGDFFFPKISDFGLAKRLDGENSGTQTGQVLGTPSYMAPEQARGAGEDVGPSADVYALGAILYELLTGRPPFRAAAILDTLEQVRTQEPVPPRRLQPTVPRDLETICLQCLRKEPARRYASAEAVAEDLHRFLAGEPIRARPVGPAERVLKWARRRPAAAALAVVSVLAVLLGVGGAVWSSAALGAAARREHLQAEEARAQRAAAQANFRRAREAAEQVDRLLTRIGEELLKQGPQVAEIRRSVLEDALRFYQGILAEQPSDPAVRFSAALAYVQVGRINQLLGRAAAVADAYGHASALLKGLADESPESPEYRQELATCYNNLGAHYKDAGRFAEAEKLYRQALGLREGLAGTYPDVASYRCDVAQSLNNLGVVLRITGRAAEAEQSLRRCLALCKALAVELPGRPDRRQALARASWNLADVLAATNRAADAEAAYREAVPLFQGLVQELPADEVHGRDLANVITNLANLLQSTGRRDEAVPYYREALAAFARPAADFPHVPRYRQDLARAQFNLGTQLQMTGKRSEAEKAYEDARAVQERLVADYPTRTDYASNLAITLNNLAEVVRDRGALAEARGHVERAIELQRRAIAGSPQNPLYPRFLQAHHIVLAETLLRQKDHAAAAQAAEELQRLAAGRWQATYDAACLVARCVPLAEADAGRPEADRQRLAQEYAGRAVALLRQAVGQGFTDADHLARDSDFASVRSRADFHQVLAELRARKQ